MARDEDLAYVRAHGGTYLRLMEFARLFRKAQGELTAGQLRRLAELIEAMEELEAESDGEPGQGFAD